MTALFRPMLAATCEDIAALQFPLLASPKLDGVRCVILNGVAYTRSMKAIPNRHIREALGGLPGLDGELTVGPLNAPDVWNASSSGVMSEDGKPDFAFNVFDVVLGDTPFQSRFSMVKRLVEQHGSRAPLRLVPHKTIANTDELAAYENRAVSAGFEGVMLRSLEGHYKQGRATLKQGWLLKLKRFFDAEATIVGVEEKMTNGNALQQDERGYAKRSSAKAGLVPAGTLGAIRCVTAAGAEFKIGTGFDANTAATLWARRDSLIGDLAKFKYQQLSPAGVPRFPVWLGVRDQRDSGETL